MTPVCLMRPSTPVLGAAVDAPDDGVLDDDGVEPGEAVDEDVEDDEAGDFLNN